MLDHKSIFISRQLSPYSKIRSLLESEKRIFRDESLIEFTPIPFELPSTKWLFFYSKTGVKYFFEQYHDAINKGYKIGCFGPSTALFCQKFQGVSFHGNTEKDTCMKLILDTVEHDDITFVCGKNSLRSVQTLSQQDFPEVVVYDHKMKSTEHLGHFNIAVLTSPMNVSSFVRNEGSADHYIAIGSTTAEAMTKSSIKPVVAPYPSESGIAQALKEYL